MPTKRKTTKRNKSRSTGMSRNIQYTGPLRRSLRSVVKYSDMYTITSGGTTPSKLMFSLNGLFDPDITGIGHQPRGFDQIMTMYDHYVVIGCKINLQISNPDVNRGNTVYSCVVDNTGTLSYVDLLETGSRVAKHINARDAGQSSCTINLNINPNKWLARSKPLSDPDLKGSATTNPTEQCYLYIAHIAEDLSTANTVNVLATFEYTTVFFEPKVPVIS